MKPIPKEDLDLIRDAAQACGFITVEHNAREFTAVHVKHSAGAKQRYWNPLQPSTGHLAELMALCSIELSTDYANCQCAEAYCYDYFHGYSVSYGRAVMSFPDWSYDSNEESMQERLRIICRVVALAAAMKTAFGRNRKGQAAQYGPSSHLDRVVVVAEHALNVFLIALRELKVEHATQDLSGEFLSNVYTRDPDAPFSEDLNQTAVYFNSKFTDAVDEAVLYTLQYFGPSGSSSGRSEFPFNLHDYNSTL